MIIMSIPETKTILKKQKTKENKKTVPHPNSNTALSKPQSSSIGMKTKHNGELVWPSGKALGW